MTTLLEHLSEEQQHILTKFRDSLPQIKQRLFDIFLSDHQHIQNSEEIIQQFLDATIFKGKKGMLSILNDQGHLERQSIEEHQIPLKDFSNSF
jgi:hypothetical protein